MKKRYTEGRTIMAIKKHEAGAKVDDLCRDLKCPMALSTTGAANMLAST